MISVYTQIAELFGDLGPYQLQHLSECVLCKLEENFEEKLCGCTSRIELTDKDLKFALIEAMQSILIELKQRQLRVERMKLNQTKMLLFADRKNAA